MRQTNVQETTRSAQAVLPVMRWWFFADMALVSIAGLQLFLLGEQTDRFFAWTIQSPLTASFLGAAYWCTLPMLFQSFRSRDWANARIAVPGVWLFTALTTIATFQYWESFHWGSPVLTARLAFWVWLGTYIVVPIGLGLAWYRQRQVPGVEPARQKPLPQWFRVLLGTQALVVAPFGVALFLFPAATITAWPWTLTLLTGAAIGAWLIGIGVTLAWATWENDWQRLRGTMITYALLGVLLSIALVRYAGDMDWNRATAWLYVAFLGGTLVMGSLGTLLARRATS